MGKIWRNIWKSSTKCLGQFEEILETIVDNVRGKFEKIVGKLEKFLKNFNFRENFQKILKKKFGKIKKIVEKFEEILKILGKIIRNIWKNKSLQIGTSVVHHNPHIVKHLGRVHTYEINCLKYVARNIKHLYDATY